MPNTPTPKCPGCGSGKHQRMNDTIKCLRCGAFYDDDPDEGGTHSNYNPAARLEREERNRSKHYQNRR